MHFEIKEFIQKLLLFNQQIKQNQVFNFTTSQMTEISVKVLENIFSWRIYSANFLEDLLNFCRYVILYC